MNKLKMAAVQERLKLKRVQIDTWTTREKLCLASAVLRSGDQNWVSVSRTLRAFDELNRPPDWFSQKNCALQYSSLLEKVDTPKRKRGERGEVHVETPGESIVRKLTSERVEELKKSIEYKRALHRKLQEEIALVKSGQADDRLDEMLQEIEEEKSQKKREAEMHAQWLKEREEKLLEIKRAWKPPAASSSTAAMSAHKQRDPESGIRRSSSQSEQSSEAESLEDSPVSSEPLQVDVIGDESLEGQGDTKPSSPLRESSPLPTSSLLLPCTTSAPATSTPTSPLLTSLLKSPSQAPSLQASSILHSAITAQRGSSPTITSLLNSSPGIPVSGASAVSSTVSAGIKSLVTSAISGGSSEESSEKTQQPALVTTSPSAGAPTLSMLLELPPSLPGKPLPEIPSIPPKLPSTPAKVSASSTPPHSMASSPQPSQSPELSQQESIELVAAKVEELEEDMSEETPEPLEKELKVYEVKEEDIKSVNNKDAVDLVETKTEKHDAVASAPGTESEDTGVSPMSEDSPVPPPQESGSQSSEIPKVSAALPTPPKNIELPVGDSERTVQGSAVEIESTADISGLTKCLTELHTKSPGTLEVNPDVIPKAEEVEIKEEDFLSPQTEVEAVDKIVIEEESLKEIVSTAFDELLPDSGEGAVSPVKTLEGSKEGDGVPEKDTAVESETKDSPDTKKEPTGGVSDREKLLTSTSETTKSAEGTPQPESASGTVKKEEGTGEAVVEEEYVERRSPCEESFLSAPDTPNSDSPVRRRGGSRGRKTRGRALTLYRMRQERLAKEKSDKDKELTAEDDVENESSREPVIIPSHGQEDDEAVKEKTQESKKAKPLEDEVSSLKSDWEEVGTEEAAEDEKKEIGASQKKSKGKKVEEPAGGGSDAGSAPPPSQSAEGGETTSKEIRTEEDGKSKGEEVVAATAEKEPITHGSAKKREDKSPAVKAEEKQSVTAEVESKHVEKSSEKKKREEAVHLEPSEQKKVPVERKSEERRTPEKKADVKVKHVPTDKKAEERKRAKEGKAERKEREERRSVEEGKEGSGRSLKDEERRNVYGKEKKVEGKDRRSLSEKRSETTGERKPSRERRTNDEKAESEKSASEKGRKEEKDLRRSDGEKKASRERKVEEKERKTVPEKKVEESKRKLVEEKKTEEVEQGKSTERESVTPTKKNVAGNTPEKSRTSSSRAAPAVMGGEKVKRKLESVEDDDSSAESLTRPPEAKQAKLSEELLSVETGSQEKVDSERRVDEEPVGKRKVDKRKGVITKRTDPEESIIMGSVTEERAFDGETTPKQSQSRKRGGTNTASSTPASSTPAATLDQVPHSPASSGSISEEERDYRAWKKAILLVWSRLATHKFASIFLRPITNDQAPGYHSVVYRPVDLHTIKKNVESGVIRTTAHFQRDVMLMFLNAIMYNSSDHDVHRMSLQMQQESLQHIQILLEASEAPKILRRETREGNKRTDSSSTAHLASTPSQDESSAGVLPLASSSAHTPAENMHINLSEEEMSDCEFPLSYCISTQKDNLSGGLSGPTMGLTEDCKKDGSHENYRKKKYELEECPDQGVNNETMGDRHSSAENSNASDLEDEKTEESAIGRPRLSKKAEYMVKKERKQSSLHLDQYPDVDLGDEQLSSSQFGDLDMCGEDVDKKQVRRPKRLSNDCIMSSEDSCSIPDDGGDWSNVLSIRGEKGDDSESVSSVFYKRRRVQRKSTNSDPESLLDAPNFPFLSNFASLEESDYQAWKRFVLMIWDQLADHAFATIFMTPVRTDEAPRYYNVVFRPMDLGTIRKNVEKGLVRTIAHFQRDVMLMLTNAIMYNPSHHDVHQKTAQMQNEYLQYLQTLVMESSEDPEVFRHEIREANNKVCSTGLEELIAASKSESASDEDHFSNIPTAGNWLSGSPTHSSLLGSACVPNEEANGNVIGKNSTADERPTKIFSKKKRISTFND